jgi:hypothetical protein
MKFVTTIQAFAACAALAFVLGTAPVTCRADERGSAVEKWPTSGTVEFQVSLGTGGMVVGLARHAWSHDSKQYQMQLSVQTTGVVALLHKLDYEQKSTGSIGPGGLRPQRFEVIQAGRKPEAALFNWEGARVSIQRGGKERRSADLAAGDQDVLSIWHHFNLLSKLPTSLLVVGNKNVRNVRVVKSEMDSLQVSAGHFATRHLRLQSEDGRLAIDLWLARDHNMVPVKVILGDDKSESLVLQATAIHLPK